MKKVRISYYDNAKLILICFVVFGHLIEPVYDSSRVNETIMNCIYLFHMPAFVFISGYFAKAAFEKGWVTKILKRYLIPYVILQLSFIAFTKWIHVGKYQFILSIPYYTFWYLFAMAVWAVVLKIIMRLKIKEELLLVVAILMGIIIGYFDILPIKFSIDRIIIFFPYYLIGYYFKERHWKPTQVICNRKVAVSLLIVLVVLIWKAGDTLDIRWLYCNTQYDDLDVWGMRAALFRTILYIAQLIAMFSVLAIIPRKQHSFTFLGRNTFGIYILHGFLIKLFISMNYYDDMTMIKYLLLLPMVFIIVELLGSKRIPVLN